MCRFFAAVVLVALSLSGCGTVECGSSLAHIKSDQTGLDFHGVFSGETAKQTVILSMGGCLATPLVLKEVPDAFTIDLGAPTLSPGEQRQVIITFAPPGHGEFSGDLVIEAAGTAEKTVAIHLEGVAIPIDYDTDPQELDFGVVRLGDSKTLSMVVPNFSDRPQHVGITSDDPAFTIEPDSLDLVGVGAGTIQVTFRPGTRGAFDGPHLHFNLCANCEEVRRTVKGVGAIEDFTLTPTPLDFGTHSPGSTACQNVTIRNTGDVPVRFVAATPDPYFTQSGVFDLQLGNLLDGSTQLEVKGSTTIKVCFSPRNEAKDYNGKIGFNTLDNDFRSLPVHGRGGTARIACVPDPLDFGLTIPSSPITKQLVCKNLGEPEDVGLRSLSVDQPENVRLDFAQDGDPSGFNVGQADFHFSATFTASIPGVYAPTINVILGRPDVFQDDQLQVHVSGTIVDGEPCTLSVRPSQVKFGLVNYAKSYSRDVQIVNTSPTSGCIVWGFGLDVLQSDRFTANGMPQGITTIPASGSLALTVVYDPKSPSSDLDTQTLTFNRVMGKGQERSVNVAISGFASELDLSVDPDPIDFGELPDPYVKTVPVSVTNLGTEPVDVGGKIGATTDAGASVFGVTNLPARLPVTLPGGGVLTFSAMLEAVSAGAATGSLEIWINDAPAPIVVPMLGSVINTPCGAECGYVAICPAAQVTWVDEAVQLISGGIAQEDPNEPGIICHWDVVSAPAGSVAVPDSPDDCTTGFLPDLEGQYDFDLTLKDGPSYTDTCTTRVTARTP